MRVDTLRGLICGALMTAFSLAAWAMVPKERLADILGSPHLEQAIPQTFGDWHVDKISQGAVINPQEEVLLQKIYKEMLSRTYVNSKEQMVMLSVSYGDDQSDGLALHYPEVCYPAQGFKVLSIKNDSTPLFGSQLPLRRLETLQGSQRYEPVTYWMMLGEHAAIDKYARKKIEFSYAFQGVKADAVLFRVSSIGRDSAEAYRLQDQFISELTRALSAKDLKRLTGLSN